MKRSSLPTFKHPNLQLYWMGAIASSLTLALASPVGATSVLPTAKTLAAMPYPSTSPTTPQSIATPEAMALPERPIHRLAEAISLPSDLSPEQSGVESSPPAPEWIPRAISPVQPPASTVAPTAVSDVSPTPGVAEPPTSTSVQVLSPAPETVLDVPATTIMVRYPVGGQVTLYVNGEPVDTGLIGRTETDASTQQVTQTWYGVGLQDGHNTISVQTLVNGTAIAPTIVGVDVRGAARQITLGSLEARIPADGRTTAALQGELLDASGNRSNRDGVVTLEASSGEWIGEDEKPEQPGFQVPVIEGQYSATLRSSLTSGMVRVRATAGDLEVFHQLEFATSLRPTLLAGVVDLRFGSRGTNYFGSLRDFLPADGDNSSQINLSGAAFLTTRIGEWQFTGAFNSDRPLNRTCNGTNALFGETQDCDQTYPVYGDSSTRDVTAPSIDQVYARLERTSPVPGAGSDFLMWGDFNTGNEFATRSQFFTATNRSLHGLYGNYNLGDLRITALYGTNVQGFQRDAIAPDGTSGYYFLSRRILVEGSENIFIETEELNRPGTVLTSEHLTRGIDYQIDYDRGSLLFSRPLLQTGVDGEGRVLVRRIVATYQYESNGDASIYGGRVQYNLSRELNRESWIAGTYVRENQGDRHFELYGADALLSFGQDGQLIAEYAHSSNTSAFLGTVGGSAYRIEASATVMEGIQGRAYYRSTTDGFTNNATTSFVPGQTRYGVELATTLSPTTLLRASYDHEDNVGVAPRSLDDLTDLLNPGSEATPGSRVDNSLTTLTVGLQQQLGDITLGLDWIHRNRQDRLTPEALTETSSQLRSRLTVPITNNLTFRAQNELNLSGHDPLYPNRTLLGIDWQVHPGITLGLNQQFFESEDSGANAITSLNFNGQYALGEDTSLFGRLALMTDYGLAGSFGLEQGWTIVPGLRATFTYEHILESEFNNTGAGAQFSQPYAVGQSGAALGVAGGDSYSVGLAYTGNPNLQANARFEHRRSSEGSNTVISASVLGRITPSLTALVNYQEASASNQQLASLGSNSTLRIGLAYRNPDHDRFNALLRYEHRRNPSTIPEDLLSNSGTGSVENLFAVEAIYAPSWRWEFYGKFALRHSTSYLADDFTSSSTVTLAQLRATYRLSDRWDLSADARWINQPSANYSELGLALEAGYYLTPNLRLSAGYSLGSISDPDFNGSRSADGLYLGVTLRLDNDLLRDFGIEQAPPPIPAIQPVATHSSIPLPSTNTYISPEREAP